MSSDGIAEEQRPRRWHIHAGLCELALGGLIVYLLCTFGPGLIDALTLRITASVPLMLIVATGLATADVGSLMLILDGLAHLRKAWGMKASSALKASNLPLAHSQVINQPPAPSKEQQ